MSTIANCLRHLCLAAGPWPFSGPCVGSVRRHRTAPAIDLCGLARVKSWIEMPKRGGQWLELGKTKLRKHEKFANLDDQTTCVKPFRIYQNLRSLNLWLTHGLLFLVV